MTPPFMTCQYRAGLDEHDAGTVYDHSSFHMLLNTHAFGPTGLLYEPDADAGFNNFSLDATEHSAFDLYAAGAHGDDIMS